MKKLGLLLLLGLTVSAYSQSYLESNTTHQTIQLIQDRVNNQFVVKLEDPILPNEEYSVSMVNIKGKLISSGWLNRENPVFESPSKIKSGYIRVLIRDVSGRTVQNFSYLSM